MSGSYREGPILFISVNCSQGLSIWNLIVLFELYVEDKILEWECQ